MSRELRRMGGGEVVWHEGATWILLVVMLLMAALAIVPASPARGDSHVLAVDGDLTLTGDHEGPIVLAGEGATLDCAGWSVLGTGEDVGVSIEASGATVRNCTITGFSIGIVSHGTSGGVIDGNVVLEPGIGIGLEMVSGYTVTGNRVDEPGESAFQFVTMTDSEVVGNDAVNEASDFGASFLFADCSIGNLVERNTSFGGDGFNFWRSGGNHVVGNTATGNPDLAAYEGTDNFLFNQSPPAEEPCGDASEGNWVERNTSVASGGQGFRVDGSPGTILDRNVARDAGRAGFGVWEGSDGTVVSRSVATDNQNGVFVGSSSDVTVERNRVEGSEFTGIVVLESEAVQVERNQSTRNGGSGILSLRSNGINAVRNYLEGNGLLGQDSAGLYVATSTGVLVQANKACDNSLHDAVQYASPDTDWQSNEFCEALFERPPRLEVSASNDVVRGFGFAPNGAVPMQVLDGSGGLVVEDPGVGTDENGDFWWDVGEDIQPGYIAEVIGGDRSVTVADLSFDVFDIEGDVLGGMAEPGSEVVLRGGDDSAEFELDGSVDAAGTWSFDVGELVGFDVGHGMWAEVFQYEPDGDATVEERPSSPYLLASPEEDFVLGYGFAPGAVTVTIGDVVHEVESDEFDGFRLDEAVEAGDVIVAEGAVYTKELTVSELGFEADPDADVVAGFVDPPTVISVDLGDAGFETEADEDGTWELRLWEFGYDLADGQGITTFAYDDDNDATISIVEGEPPTPTIRVNYQNDWVEGWDFTPDAEVVVTIGEESFVETASPDGYVFLEVWESVDIGVGDVVTADDGERAAKSLTVVDLTFDTFDPATGTLGGGAPAGTVVTLYAGVELPEVEADADGRWEITGVEGLSDESPADAVVIDEDGDATLVHRPPSPAIVASQ
jgi:nitrous oxidase accessory protein NosD